MVLSGTAELGTASLLAQEGRSTPLHNRWTGHATKGASMSVVGDTGTDTTERANSVRTAAPATASDLVSAFPSHDRWNLLVNAVGRATESWGNTLRLAFLIVITGTTVRVLAGPIPWDQLAALFKLGG
jgi:hypothetical protein